MDGDDDDFDFQAPRTGGSKLGGLFSRDRANSGMSLSYNPKKDPKAEKAKAEKAKAAAQAPAPQPAAAQPAAAPGQLGVLFAVQSGVHAYKYENNSPTAVGKLGCAVIGNHGAKQYKIILYAANKQQVCVASITSEFSFTPQANNYAQFYDDRSQSWSINFSSEQEAIDFAKQICLAKGLTAKDKLVRQDLLPPPEGQSIQDGDTVEMRYTGCLLQNNAFGSVFDSNLSKDKAFKVKLGAGKVIKGWDTGLSGMKKGGKAVLYIPPALAYGGKGVPGTIPADATLLFEVEVVRDGAPDAPQRKNSSEDRGRSGSASSASGDLVKSRAASIEQVNASPAASGQKGQLLARMARMGQATLPLGGAVVASADDVSDSEGADLDDMMPAPAPAPAPAQRKPEPEPVQ
eukprot:Colp12_sorted_trinity150504_noHs@7631